MGKENKLRLLLIYQYLRRNTDAEHPVTTPELISLLHDQYGLEVNRNTLPCDIADLNEAGLKVGIIRSQANKYYYDGNTFDQEEMKLLADMISSCVFIPEDRSRDLLAKLMTLTNCYEEEALQRPLRVIDRVPSIEASGYQNLDIIYQAISQKKKIRFKYEDRTARKKKDKGPGAPKSNVISPFAILFDGACFIMVGFNDRRGIVQPFRLDQMTGPLEITKMMAREIPDDFDAAALLKQDQDPGQNVQKVILECDPAVIPELTDRFACQVIRQEAPVVAEVSAKIDKDFFGWLFVHSEEVKLTGPEEIRTRYLKMLKKAAK